MFHRDISSQLDAVIILLEARPPLWIRFALRLWKRHLERAIVL